MKKFVSFMIFCLLFALLAGCQTKELDVMDLDSPQAEIPLQLESLSVEISKGTLDTQTLMAAVKDLPDLLRTYFSETDVEIGEIKVTVGSSPAHTAQAVESGGIQLAFLPAEGFLTAAGDAAVLFADAQTTDSGQLSSGTRSLICATPTEYGTQLNNRASSGKPLSWEELKTARWGVLPADSLGGYQCFDLWLSDNYDGNRITDLPQVTLYGSYEELFRAAAIGEIDALVVRDDVRTGISEAWTREETQTDAGWIHGFGRDTDIWQEIPVLDVTERLYSQLVIAVPELADERFAAALEQVLTQMAEKTPEQMEVLGSAQFISVNDDELDPTRRLTTLG